MRVLVSALEDITMVKNISQSWGVASLVLGILSLILFWVPFLGLVLAILAIVGFVLQKRDGSNGVATAGLVLGILAIVLGLPMLIITSLLMSTSADDFSDSSSCEEGIYSGECKSQCESSTEIKMIGGSCPGSGVCCHAL